MPLAKPFYLTYRPNIQNTLDLYMHDARYIEHPSGLLASIQVLYKDFERLFEYVEPNDDNKDSYSLRTYELLIRTCIEVESQFKSILITNGYQKNEKKCVMDPDYFKVNASHHLSEYEVLMPIWKGGLYLRKPFYQWNRSVYQSLPWYQAYNHVKHNRIKNFPSASLQNATDALCGLVVLLASQFHNPNFAEREMSCAYGFAPFTDGLELAIGAPFRIKFPGNWAEEEKYDFKWNDIKDQANPYNSLSFT